MLKALARCEEAAESYRAATVLRPGYAAAHNNLANAMRDRLEIDAAMAGYRRALYFQPDHADAHWNRSLLLLLTGDFENGWHEYEWRWRRRERAGRSSPALSRVPSMA